jgi:hypothetical protein
MPGGGFPLHDKNNGVHAVHIVLDKVRGDVEEVHLAQLLQYCLHFDAPFFWGCRERGARNGELHDHLLALFFIDVSKRGIDELRASLYSWLHDGNPDPSLRVPVRHSTGYKLWTAFLKQGQTLLGVLGYLDKDAGLSHHKGDGASWPENRLHSSMFKGGKVLTMCSRTRFFGRRARAIFSAKRPGTPVNRSGIVGALFRIINGPDLKYIAPFTSLLEQLRLMLIADTLLKIRPHDDLALDSMHRPNPRAIAIMGAWDRADDDTLYSIVNEADVNFVWFRGLASTAKPNPDRSTVGYTVLNSDEVDWGSVTYQNAVDLNAQVAGSVADRLAASQASRFSTDLMSHDALRARLEAGTFAIDGYTDNTGRPASGPAVPRRAEEPRPRPTPPPLLAFSPVFIAAARPFLSQFTPATAATKTRFLFLVIVGATKTGKSQFAEHALGFRSPYVNEGSFYLQGFDKDNNDAIILSDVPGITSFVLQYKAVFQSNDNVTMVGGSSTNMYAISVNTHQTPIVITMNKEEDWEKMKNEAWITGNSYVIDCGDTPMFVGNNIMTEEEERRAEGWRDASQ